MAEKKIDNQRCVTPVFRVAFAKVFKAEDFQGDGKFKYSLAMLFPRNANLSALMKCAEAAKVKLWGADKTKWPKNVYSPFLDGDDKSDLVGYADHTVVNVSNQNKPEIVDSQLCPITEESREFYSGCYAIASVRASAYGGPGTKFKPGVAFYLEAVQKKKDGDKFSGAKSANEVFTASADGDDAGLDEASGW